MDQRQDLLGNRVTVGNDRTLSVIDDFVGGFLAYERRALGILAGADADPGCALANAYAGMLHMLLEAPAAAANALPYLQKARRAAPAATGREQGAVQFLELWHADDVPGAQAVAEEIVAEFPRDLVMVKLYQYLCFNLGDVAGMLRIAEAAAPAGANLPWLHGMLAFAHEQNHRLRDAESAAYRALSLSAREPWAQHALAHVMLTEGRIEEGAAFLDGVKHHWTGLNSFMVTHLWWHRALFDLERGGTGEALALYDREIWGIDKSYSQDQIGAVSLLARIELAGGEVGGRWAELAPWLAARGSDTVQPFLSLQYLYGLARAGAGAAARLLLDAIRERAHSAPSFVRARWVEVAVPAAEGLLACAEGDYAGGSERLRRALPRLIEIGGSHAQRDLFERIWKNAEAKRTVVN